MGDTDRARFGTRLLGVASCLVFMGALAGDAGAQEEEEEPLNGFELGFTHSFQLLRTSPSEAVEGRSENLWGFILSYERTLIPGRLVLVIAKPFHFSSERFDSPLDVYLKVNFPKGRWEPYVGAGISGNLRVFSGELEQEEGRRLEYTFGVGAMTGFVYRFTPRWGITLEVGYFYFVNGLTQHSISDALAGVFFF